MGNCCAATHNDGNQLQPGDININNMTPEEKAEMEKASVTIQSHFRNKKNKNVQSGYTGDYQYDNSDDAARKHGPPNDLATPITDIPNYSNPSTQ
mmetsp:Transcript_41454/g.36830  ORF Transcript_41454/g.36830 Transcript_41454/m.36830 type:complete len:95 (+) Transcript_41454:60-344(+)